MAEAGSVAGAIRWLAKAIITGGCNEFVTSSELPELRGNLTSERGLGQRVIEDRLANVPSLDRNMITQHLASLKASGDYARIINEVAAKVLREQPDVEVAKIAQEAAVQAQEHYGAVAFDFSGVARHLRNSHQIEVFRTLATGKALKNALPVENQAPLAKHLVAVAQSRKNAEVSGAFVREPPWRSCGGQKTPPAPSTVRCTSGSRRPVAVSREHDLDLKGTATAAVLGPIERADLRGGAS